MRICDVPWIVGALSPLISAQITVMSPKDLVAVFNSTQGFIPGSTAAFGTPYYGERILGGLFWGEPHDAERPHCTEGDYKVAVEGAKGLAPIFLVRRGGCSFVTKVRIAESKGAKAVLIVDHEGLAREEVQYIVMADDGWGENIKIPSILLSKADGEFIVSGILKNKGQPPVVELSWDLHQRHTAKMDLWTSPGVYSGARFLTEYAPHARALGHSMHFQPHYHAVSLHLTVDDNKLCIDGRVDLCTEDPDQAGPVTGEAILYESVRQFCIWERTKYSTVDPTVAYSAQFWDYVEKLPTKCPMACGDGKNGCKAADHFGRTCSEKVMKEVGIDMAVIQDCIDKEKYTILENERDNHAWNVVALRINDWRYSGPMSADIVTRALCSGFVSPPDSCRKLLGTEDKKQETKDNSLVQIYDRPVGVGELIGALLVVILLLCCCGVVARKIIIRNTRESMRYEIMNEVNDQIRASRTGASTSI